MSLGQRARTTSSMDVTDLLRLTAVTIVVVTWGRDLGEAACPCGRREVVFPYTSGTLSMLAVLSRHTHRSWVLGHTWLYSLCGDMALTDGAPGNPSGTSWHEKDMDCEVGKRSCGSLPLDCTGRMLVQECKIGWCLYVGPHQSGCRWRADPQVSWMGVLPHPRSLTPQTMQGMRYFQAQKINRSTRYEKCNNEHTIQNLHYL
jgi:hypothetical protein